MCWPGHTPNSMSNSRSRRSRVGPTRAATGRSRSAATAACSSRRPTPTTTSCSPRSWVRGDGLANVNLPAGGISAAVGSDVDVVVVAVAGSRRPAGRVIGAAPDNVLQREAVCVLEREPDDLVAERYARGAGRVGNHDVDRQTPRMPWERIWPDAADALDLRERRADAAGGQDRLDL